MVAKPLRSGQKNSNQTGRVDLPLHRSLTIRQVPTAVNSAEMVLKKNRFAHAHRLIRRVHNHIGGILSTISALVIGVQIKKRPKQLDRLFPPLKAAP